MTTYNKSAIMKEAHYWRRVLGYTMSRCLKMAWNNAKTQIRLKEERIAKNEAYRIMKEKQAKNTIVTDMSYLANSLSSYYNRGSGVYFGD